MTGMLQCSKKMLASSKAPPTPATWAGADFRVLRRHSNRGYCCLALNVNRCSPLIV